MWKGKRCKREKAKEKQQRNDQIVVCTSIETHLSSIVQLIYQ